MPSLFIHQFWKNFLGLKNPAESGSNSNIFIHCHIETICTVGRHFRLPGHSTANLGFLPFEKVYSQDKGVLAARERYWINLYGAVGSGLNVNHT